MKKFIAIVAAILIAVSASAGTGITGFLPQKTGYKQNFTPDEIADYAFQGAKPDITPSNKFWDDNYEVYASYLKEQIVTWMRAETGNPNLSEAQAEAKFRKMPVRKTTGKVEAIGLSINKATGDILGLDQPIERDPYETVDGLGEYEIYGKKGAMSCVCCNAHLGIEATQDEDEWEQGASKKSSTYKVPSGITSLIINNYNNSSATANPTATATNTPATKGSSDDGTWKDPNNGPDWGWQQKKTVYYCPYCGFSNCDGSCRSMTTTVTTKSGCNNCGTTNTQYEKQMLRNARANTVANYIMPIGNAVLGAFLNSRWQKPPVNNYYNYTINNPNDNDNGGGDGGNLPGTNYPSPNYPNYPDPNGDGGNLPAFNGKKVYNNGLK